MDWGTAAAIAATAAVIGGFFMWFFKRALPAMRKWSRRADLLFGVPADPASRQEHVAGLLERMDAQDSVLQGINSRMDGQDESLQAIRHEVETNTGTSLKDAVKNIERRLDSHLTPRPDQSTTININPPEAQP